MSSDTSADERTGVPARWLLHVDLDQFIAAIKQIDDFFVQVVRLPQR